MIQEFDGVKGGVQMNRLLVLYDVSQGSRG